MLIIGDVNMKTMNNLEKELISQIKNNDQKYSLSKGLLIASGLSSESEIDKYMEKLDQLTANFKQYLKEKHIGRSFDDKTKALSQFLWNGNKLDDDNPDLLFPSLIMEKLTLKNIIHKLIAIIIIFIGASILIIL